MFTNVHDTLTYLLGLPKLLWHVKEEKYSYYRHWYLLYWVFYSIYTKLILVEYSATEHTNIIDNRNYITNITVRPPQYNLNIAKVGVKHQSINQSRLFYIILNIPITGNFYNKVLGVQAIKVKLYTTIFILLIRTASLLSKYRE